MADDGGRRILQLLSGNERDVLDQWVAAASEPLRGRVSESELRRVCGDLLTALISAVTEADLDIRADAYAGARALLADMSRDRARRGFTPSETAAAVFALKEALFAAASTADDPLAVIVESSRWVDALGSLTFESFSQAREEVITEQAEQLLELTTPVVKLWDGVLAVPLIGTLDSARTQIVMEKLLQSLVDTGSEHAIIDITGVPAVDTEVAQHLLKTVVAARLMGAECTLSGIRPQIAQTIVALGIEFGDIPTKATLADALLHALRGSGVEIVRRQRTRAL
ncbi:MAG TPA: STAS domain-containing protein [Pseudonocardia sp.]|jgi:rsbT co-antagonist protein RsbR|nr:STAS domain-containing protein [Pseudonocardia sp.]